MDILRLSLIAWRDPNNHDLYVDIKRVLWISPDKHSVITISLGIKKGMPQSCSMKDLCEDLAYQRAEITTDDPFAYLHRDESSLSEKERASRDRIHAVLGPLLEIHFEALLCRQKRGAFVTRIMKDHKWKKKEIYKYLRRYWQGGCVKNCFLPDWHLRGGKGKRKSCSPDKKRGRPSDAWLTNRSSDWGINVDADIRARLIKGIKEFYKDGRTFTSAFEDIKRKHFVQEMLLQNGVWVPQLWSVLPTIEQARYVYQTEFLDETKKLLNKVGRHRVNLQHRALIGNPNRLVIGPGSLYQIDATVGDIYLRSQLDPQRVIGRPVIYLVVDVFSRMIAGFAVLMEGPSWMGAMQALENAFCNKVEFCQGLGITISPNDWPCEGLPESILADNGEFLGYNAESLVQLGVPVHQAAPLRPDWKGLVERYFRTVHDRINWVPGYVHPDRDRGDPDYRLDGALTPRSLRELLVWCIQQYNLHHHLDRYPLTQAMIEDHITPYPAALWNWGVQEGSSALRAAVPDQVRACLLPRDTARVTRQGIRFKSLYYMCSTALTQQWCVKASLREWTVDVAYHPRSTKILFACLNDGRTLEPCQLLERVNETSWQGQDLYDVEDYFKIRSIEGKVAKQSKTQRTASFVSKQEAIVEAAVQARDSHVPSISKSAQLKAIGHNKRLEQQYEQQQHVAKYLPAPQAEPGPPPPDSQDEYVPPDKPYDLLRQMRERRAAQWKNPSNPL